MSTAGNQVPKIRTRPNDPTAALLGDHSDDSGDGNGEDDSDYEPVHKCVFGPKNPIKHLKAALRNVFYSDQDYSDTISYIQEDLRTGSRPPQASRGKGGTVRQRT